MSSASKKRKADDSNTNNTSSRSTGIVCDNCEQPFEWEGDITVNKEKGDAPRLPLLPCEKCGIQICFECCRLWHRVEHAYRVKKGKQPPSVRCISKACRPPTKRPGLFHTLKPRLNVLAIKLLKEMETRGNNTSTAVVATEAAAAEGGNGGDQTDEDNLKRKGASDSNSAPIDNGNPQVN